MFPIIICGTLEVAYIFSGNILKISFQVVLDIEVCVETNIKRHYE